MQGFMKILLCVSKPRKYPRSRYSLGLIIIFMEFSIASMQNNCNVSFEEPLAVFQGIDTYRNTSRFNDFFVKKKTVSLLTSGPHKLWHVSIIQVAKLETTECLLTKNKILNQVLEPFIFIVIFIREWQYINLNSFFVIYW